VPMYQRLQRLELCRLQLAQLHLASSRLAVPLAPGQVQHAHRLMGESRPAVPASSLVGASPTPNNDLATSLEAVAATLGGSNAAYLVHTIIDVTDRTVTDFFLAIPSFILVMGCEVVQHHWCVQQYRAFTNLRTSPPPSPTLDSCWWIISATRRTCQNLWMNRFLK
jgi:hypothetical protein